MNKKESLVEDTFLQLKDLENVIAENAQGILASTMKQEIKELVKESLDEQEDEEIDLDAEVDTDADNDEIDFDDEIDVNTDMDFDDEIDVDDDTIDLTKASDEEVLRVFKAMGDEDGIIVKKDDDMIHLSDDNEDVEYLIQLGESEFDFSDLEDEEEEVEDEFSGYDFSDLEDEEEDEVIYELELDSKMDMMDKEEDEEEEGGDIGEFSESWKEEEEEDEEYVMEASKFKAKGVGMGNASKFKYNKKPNLDYKPKKMKQGTRGVGMGKAKFEYKEDVNVDKKMKSVKKVETKEASRTNSFVTSGKVGLRKGSDRTVNRTKVRVQESTQELNLLREKNEEYRKALNLFRTKLNEVAVFNSNLAYATRLFTEHSTTKQEKINILKRFDNAESLKESKNLYRTIKNELSNTSSKDNTITESIERNVVKTPSSGSATNLIESKTYENPQFLRMKDLMGKLK
jgi:hypothetical protein